MRRTSGLIVCACAVLAVACSPARRISDRAEAPFDETASDGSGDVAAGVIEGGDGAAGGGSAGVELPGLVDPSDRSIDNDPDVRTGTLGNGLRYYVRNNDRPGGKADLRLAIRAGSVNETGSSTGVAHFVEHMLFNGTERYPENELIDVLRGFGASFGADVNASTSYDETVYSLNVPNDDASVDTALDVLSEWLSHATFEPAQVESERGIILDEWRTRTQTTDGRLFGVAEGLYLAGSAYAGRSPIGTDTAIATVARSELVEFYDDWYRPDNAAIVVVGDIEVDAMVAEIEARFADATPRGEAMPARPDTAVPVGTEPAFALHADPDQTTVDVEIDLPLPAFDGEGTAALRAALIDQMIFDTLVRRLDLDISAGVAPFDEIAHGSNSFVESLDAPALYAITTADRVDATLAAVLDEYERANRFGFGTGEVDAARAIARSRIDALLDGGATTQDDEFADEYVDHFLHAAPYPAVADLHAIATGVIEGITPSALDLRFRARWQHSAPHVIISAPDGQAGAMPSEAEVIAAVEQLADRALEPRAGARELPDDLMAAPDPVAPITEESMLGTDDPLFDPVELVFPNGARVIATTNEIVEGQIAFSAGSPGGSSLVDDGDVIDALYAADVVTSSGVGGFNQTELEQILADRDVEVAAQITPYVDGFGGTVGSSDLEALFQLVHLYMTQPRFDPVALGQVQRSVGPVIDDPSSDPDVAGYDALLVSRYGGEPRYRALPSPDGFATLDLAGVERVWRSRVDDAGDWVFVFAGDIDLDELADLAARYVGTLPGTGSRETWVDVSPASPDGVVETTVRAGSGDTAAITMLFTSEVAAIDGELRATTDVVTEVISTRLTDVVREQLGESYSPSVFLAISNDPTPVIETYVFVTGAPDRVTAVGDLVVAELADLAAAGPSEREFGGAYAQVEEAYGFVDNNSFVEELLNDAIWPDRSLAEYFDEFGALAGVTPSSVQQYIDRHVPVGRFVEVVVVPR